MRGPVRHPAGDVAGEIGVPVLWTSPQYRRLVPTLSSAECARNYCELQEPSHGGIDLVEEDREPRRVNTTFSWHFQATLRTPPLATVVARPRERSRNSAEFFGTGRRFLESWNASDAVLRAVRGADRPPRRRQSRCAASSRRRQYHRWPRRSRGRGVGRKGWRWRFRQKDVATAAAPVTRIRARAKVMARNVTMAGSAVGGLQREHPAGPHSHRPGVRRTGLPSVPRPTQRPRGRRRANENTASQELPPAGCALFSPTPPRAG